MKNKKMPCDLSAIAPFVTFPTLMVSIIHIILRYSRCWGCCMQGVEPRSHAQSSVSRICSSGHTEGEGRTPLWAAGKSSAGDPSQVTSVQPLLCSSGEDEEKDDNFFCMLSHYLLSHYLYAFFLQWDQPKLSLGCSSLWHDYS